jgi:hypothetical protein
MGAGARFWLSGLVAGLFALAILPFPSLHASAMLERAAFAAAYAMPDGSLPELCSGHALSETEDGHGQHLNAAPCLACLVMTAADLPPPSYAVGGRAGAPLAAWVDAAVAPAPPALAWAARRARAPPAGSSI